MASPIKVPLELVKDKDGLLAKDKDGPPTKVLSGVRLSWLGLKNNNGSHGIKAKSGKGMDPYHGETIQRTAPN